MHNNAFNKWIIQHGHWPIATRRGCGEVIDLRKSRTVVQTSEYVTFPPSALGEMLFPSVRWSPPEPAFVPIQR